MPSPLPSTNSSGSPDSAAGRRNRRADIQGLRAVAVLMVVTFHAGLPVPGGFVGVDVFFVISGFVITGMLQREWLRTGTIRFGQFYLRRFKRLTPALAMMVTVTMLVSILVLSPFGAQQTAAKTAIGAMLLVANLVIARTTGGYFDAPAEANPLLNTWSLSVEEQFYLAFPALLALGWIIARRRAALNLTPLVLVGGVALVSFALAALASTVWSSPTTSWLLDFYSPITRAWEFAVGAVLCLILDMVRCTSPRVAAYLGVLGAGMLGASLWLITDATPFPGFWTLLPVTGTLLLLHAGATSDNPFSRALSAGPMVRIGDWSYSIYLWHWPLIVFAGVLWPTNSVAVALAAVFSLAPALASYRWVEQPLRSFTPRTRLQLDGIVAATILIPVVSAGVLSGGSRYAWWLDWPGAATSGQDTHVAMARGCTDRPFDPAQCTWNADGATGRVLLAGDSQANAFADGVINAADQLGMSTTVSSRSNCPLSTSNTTGDKPYDCPAWQRDVVRYALQERPDVVVIANRSAGYTHPESGWRTVLDSAGTPATSANAAQIYESGLNDVVRELRSAGIGVVVVQNIPEPERLDGGPSLLRRLLPAESPAFFDASRTRDNRAPAARAEASVATSNPGTLLYDPIAILCPSGSCPLLVNDQSVYFDTWHLTRDGALLLSPSMREAIQRAAAGD